MTAKNKEMGVLKELEREFKAKLKKKKWKERLFVYTDSTFYVIFDTFIIVTILYTSIITTYFFCYDVKYS